MGKSNDAFNRLKNYLILGFFVLFLINVGIARHYRTKYREQKRETERVNNNYRIRGDSIKHITGENGLLASRLEAQELTLKEINLYYKNIAADLADMKIQMRKVSQITAFNTETTNNVHTFFKDSVILDTVKIEYLRYRSQWLDLDIVKKDLAAEIKSTCRDSLIQVVHWDYKGRFWPTRWMTGKVYYQDIKSMNPGSVIKYCEWIVPYKRKR